MSRVGHLSLGAWLNGGVATLESRFDPSRIGSFPTTVTSASRSLHKETVGLFAIEYGRAANVRLVIRREEILLGRRHDFGGQSQVRLAGHGGGRQFLSTLSIGRMIGVALLIHDAGLRTAGGTF